MEDFARFDNTFLNVGFRTCCVYILVKLRALIMLKPKIDNCQKSKWLRTAFRKNIKGIYHISAERKSFLGKK
jgi:hypothetical protein